MRSPSTPRPTLAEWSGETPRWIVGTTVMLTTVMVILDMTVVNVALPHMMGALGATTDQITWVLTGYIVAEAIFIPLTGFLAGRLGRKRLMLISVAGFVVSSALCGQAQTISQIVLFRICQGAFGASVIPLSQSTMVDAFPGNERGKAMAIWGIGIMLGPILGPTVGGYITEHLNWRWVFYINVPVGILNLWMIQRYLRPAATTDRSAVDWFGALVMAAGIGSLQFVLDRGDQDNWFASNTITLLTVISGAALVLFAARSWQRADSVVQLRLLRDRNLAVSSFMMLAFGLGLFGTVALQPLMLQRLLGYPAETTGLIMAPRGLASAFGMFLVSRMITRIDPRAVVLTGLALAAGGTYAMSAYDLYVSPIWLIWPGVLQGLGMGVIFVPLSAIAFQTLPRTATDHASGIFNLARTIGASIGISVVSTIVSQTSQANWNTLGGHINPYNPALHGWLAAQGLNLQNPIAPRLLAAELGRQSAMIGFVDAFYFVTLSFLALAALVVLLQGPSKPHRESGPDTSASGQLPHPDPPAVRRQPVPFTPRRRRDAGSRAPRQILDPLLGDVLADVRLRPAGRRRSLPTQGANAAEHDGEGTAHATKGVCAMRNLQNPRTETVTAAARAISQRPLTMAALLLLGAVALSPVAHADAKQDLAVQQGVSAVKSGDFTLALARLQPPAKAKNPKAAYWLGRMYEYGLGVKKNMNTAVKWYRTSADAGWATAKLHLGEIYLEGTEELQNFGKAHKWLEKAADDGNARAQRDLGKLYANGWGVKKDPVWAYVWYELAAEHGDYDAQRLRNNLLKTMSADRITEAQRLTQTVAPEAFGPAGTKSNKPANHSGQHHPHKNGSATKPASQSGAQSGA